MRVELVIAPGHSWVVDLPVQLQISWLSGPSQFDPTRKARSGQNIPFHNIYMTSDRYIDKMLSNWPHNWCVVGFWVEVYDGIITVKNSRLSINCESMIFTKQDGKRMALMSRPVPDAVIWCEGLWGRHRHLRPGKPTQVPDKVDHALSQTQAKIIIRRQVLKKRLKTYWYLIFWESTCTTAPGRWCWYT